MLHRDTSTHTEIHSHNNAPTFEQHLSKYLFKRTTTYREKFVILNWMTVCVFASSFYADLCIFHPLIFHWNWHPSPSVSRLFGFPFCFDLWKSVFLTFYSIFCGFGVGVGCFGFQKDCLLKWHVWVWPQRELFYQEASSPTKEFFKLKGARMRPLTNKYIPWISGYKSLDTSPKTPPLPLSKSITRHRLFTEPTELAVLTNDFN